MPEAAEIRFLYGSLSLALRDSSFLGLPGTHGVGSQFPSPALPVSGSKGLKFERILISAYRARHPVTFSLSKSGRWPHYKRKARQLANWPGFKTT